MSVDAALRALEWPDGSPVQRHVLLVVGVQTDHKTGWCRSTLDGLARATGLGRSTVARTITELVQRGVVEQTSTNGRNSNEYRLTATVHQPSRSGTVNRLGTVPLTISNSLATVSQQIHDQPKHGRVGSREGIGGGAPPPATANGRAGAPGNDTETPNPTLHGIAVRDAERSRAAGCGRCDDYGVIERDDGTVERCTHQEAR